MNIEQASSGSLDSSDIIVTNVSSSAESSSLANDSNTNSAENSRVRAVASTKLNRLISTEYIDSDLQLTQEDIYIFVKFLGHGAFGKVNLYRNSKDNFLVVWKEINLKNLDQKIRNESFSEVEILSLLNHPNIITYFKHFISDDTLYIELEYAKGGNLASLIKNQKLVAQKYFDEETVLWYLYQLTNAVVYIHDLGIMHRDIKALNIFLMQSGLLKLGDFGIAKVLDSNGLAESQVGTPFYMSPELVEGKKYSYKSDIWSLGCVAYEIISLEKVFDATNQLKLALKISKCEMDLKSFDLIDIYNQDLKDLIKRILSKDPEKRPNAQEIIKDKIFQHKANEFRLKIENLSFNKKSRNSNIQNIIGNEIVIQTQTSTVSPLLNTTQNSIITASKLSEVYIFGGGTYIPKQIDFFKNEHAPLHVSIGPFHYAVITSEKELYTWAAPNNSGLEASAKLGHGKSAGFSRAPKRVEAFSSSGVYVDHAVCGEDFTCVCSDDGDLYTFGCNYFGCLGIGDETGDKDEKTNDTDEKKSINKEIVYDPFSKRINYVFKPMKNKYFEANSLKVKKMACGDAHVIVLTKSNKIFTWGCGEYGRLGHGDEEDRYEPTEIKFNFKYIFKNVFAGPDSSFLLTKEGRVLAFGNNEHNKLGLNTSNIGFKNDDNQMNLKNSNNIVIQTTPKIVKNLLPYYVSKISSGNNHTAIVDNYGRLYTFGNNKFGQLGVGDPRPRIGVNLVNTLIGHCVTNVACGDSFSLCSTSENFIFSWGLKKDGRLGIDSNLDSASFASCIPKTIFGSLHQVSELGSRYWHSIIIAEQILNTKPVRSVSYADYMRKGSSTNASYLNSLESDLVARAASEINARIKSDLIGFSASSDDYDRNSSSNNNNNSIVDENQLNNDDGDDSGVPEWLKNDLKEAEFIPIEALRMDFARVVERKGDDEKNNKPIEGLEEALKVIEKLRLENENLKIENNKLKARLESTGKE